MKNPILLTITEHGIRKQIILEETRAKRYLVGKIFTYLMQNPDYDTVGSRDILKKVLSTPRIETGAGYGIGPLHISVKDGRFI